MRLSHLQRDIVIIFVSIVVTIYFVRHGFLDQLLGATGEMYALGSFVAGLFFTSVLTITLASAALAGFSGLYSPLAVAFWGALGAMIGDMVLFLFMRDIFADDVRKELHRHRYAKFLSYFHFGFLKWLSPLLGAAIIVSPLPDEIGLTLLGFSKRKTIVMLPLTFVLNFLGILLLAWFAGTL